VVETVNISTFEILAAIAGILVAVSFALLFRAGFRDKAYPIPPAVLCVWLARDVEGIFDHFGWGIVFYTVPLHIAIEAAFIYQVFAYGGKEERAFSKRALAVYMAVGTALSAYGTFALNRALQDPLGITSVMIAVLFGATLWLAMFYRRGSAAGQSIPGISCLAAGMILATIAIAVDPPGSLDSAKRNLDVFLAATCVLFLLAYIAELIRANVALRAAQNSSLPPACLPGVP
jgi:hypothetical protein